MQNVNNSSFIIPFSNCLLKICKTGSSSFSGRIYKVKNLSANAITLAGNGADKIRSQNTISNATFSIPAGYYVEVVNNTNAAGGATWDLSFAANPADVSPNWVFTNLYDYTSQSPQVVGTNSAIAYNIITPLTGYSQDITIPANKQAKVVISYSILVGSQGSVSDRPTGYYGVTLFKGGNQVAAGSRKSSIFTPNQFASFSMLTISGMYADNISASSSAQTFNYSLSAYVESAIKEVRYGMYSNTSVADNFNWGYGYWTITVYTRNP